MANGLVLRSESQQVSSGLQGSSQYSDRSQQCCILDGLDSISDFELFHLSFPAFGDCSKRVNNNCYDCHPCVPQLSKLSGKVQVLVSLPSVYIFTLWSVAPCEFFHTSSNMVFHWMLSDSKSLQISRSLLSIIVYFSNDVVWIVSILILLSSSSNLLSRFLKTVLRVNPWLVSLPPSCFTAFSAIHLSPGIWPSFHLLSLPLCFLLVRQIPLYGIFIHVNNPVMLTNLTILWWHLSDSPQSRNVKQGRFNVGCPQESNIQGDWCQKAYVPSVLSFQRRPKQWAIKFF